MEEWLTEQQAADWLSLTVDEVRVAIESGELPALRVGSRVRLSRTKLIELGGGVRALSANGGPDNHLPGPAQDGRLPAPRGLEWLDRLEPGEAFDYRWPARAKGPGTGSYRERYTESWTGRIRLAGEEMIARVGRSTGAERSDSKPRMTIFFDNYPMA